MSGMVCIESSVNRQDRPGVEHPIKQKILPTGLILLMLLSYVSGPTAQERGRQCSRGVPRQLPCAPDVGGEVAPLRANHAPQQSQPTGGDLQSSAAFSSFESGRRCGGMCVRWTPSVGAGRPHSRPQDPSSSRGAWLVGAGWPAGPLDAAWNGEEWRGAARRAGVQLLW